MIESLITSQTRIKLLIKFFLNSKTRSHLRGLESEFGESTNGIRIELNRLEDANLLTSQREGNRKYYSANRTHPLFKEIHNIVFKQTGIDRVIESIIERIGNLESVYLIGELARGIDSETIEIVLVGNEINRKYLLRKIEQCEVLIGRRVSYKLFKKEEANEFLMDTPPAELLLIWSSLDQESGRRKEDS